MTKSEINRKKSKIKKILTQNKNLIMAIIFGFILAFIILVRSFSSNVNLDLGILNDNTTKINNDREELKYEMPLSGVMVSNEDLIKRRPFAVSIENSSSARPQSGLDKADIVYETVSEGGITRFLAIFQQYEPNEIGPIRSARTYFLDWLSPFDAIFVHIGGSDAAKNLIYTLGIKEIDDMKGDKSFWRDKTREAPHNAYSNYEKIKKVAFLKGYALNFDAPSYLFKEDLEKDKRPIAQTVNIIFSSVGGYSTSWIYDKESNVYKRSLAGNEHKDRVTSKQLAAKNLIVQEIAQSPSSNSEQHFKKTFGQGKATVYLDGQQVVATWKKADRKSLTRFYDSVGVEIKFNRGQSWFSVIDQYGRISVS